MNLIYLILFVLVLADGLYVWQHSSGQSALCIKDFNQQRTIFLRCILAISIIVHHLACVVHEQGIPVVSEFMSWGGVVVSVFFFITGYGMTVSYINKGEQYIDSFLQKRLYKLIPPFLFVTIVYLVADSLVHHTNSFAKIGGLVHGYTPLPTSWFVFAIIFFYLAFYLAARLFRDKYKIFFALLAMCIAYTAVLYLLKWDGCWYKSVFGLNLGVGYACVEGRIKRAVAARPTRCVLWLCAAFLFLVALRAGCTLCGVGDGLWKTAIYYTIPLFIVLSVYFLGAWNTKATTFLGGISYEIYLVQGAFVYMLAPLKHNAPLYFLLTIWLSVLCAYVVNKLFSHRKK